MENTENKTKAKKKNKKHKSTLDELRSQVKKFAVKTAESAKKVIDKALAARNTVMSIHINEDSNKKLKTLVDVGLFKSRSESAAFLIQEGIKSQDALFDKISSKVKKIDQIKKEIKGIVSKEIEKEST
ncbi:MAG: hypothetical protein GQ536_03350 [Candidatus Aminicenantes bacterium]|nr:hypothetical protein [Candidatus Aminicenantes bacterium]